MSSTGGHVLRTNLHPHAHINTAEPKQLDHVRMIQERLQTYTITRILTIRKRKKPLTRRFEKRLKRTIRYAFFSREIEDFCCNLNFLDYKRLPNWRGIRSSHFWPSTPGDSSGRTNGKNIHEISVVRLFS